MDGIFYFDEIYERLSKKQNENGLSSHDKGRVKDAFPFPSSKLTKVFNENINEIIGELVRHTNNLKKPEIENDGDFIYSENPLINKVIENVDFNGGDNQEVLAGFLEDFLFNNGEELKPLHLYLFNYILLQEEKKGEKEKYSRFIYDLLFDNNAEISSLFSSKETENLLTELILTSLPELEYNKNPKSVREKQYTNTIPVLKSLFVSDFLFLSKHKEYFINHFFQLIHYYTFQYVLQFLKKSQQFGKDSEKELESFHFTFDWETGIGGYREAVEDYQMIKSNARNLFVHIHCLSHLSQTPNPSSELKSYNQLLKELKLLSVDEQVKEQEKLTDWIERYSELIYTAPPQELENNLDFRELFKILFTQLQTGMSNDVCEKYGKNIDNLGKNKFLKARGKHGYILSLKQDDFLMLSAVTVKERKKPLKEFFLQLERRGIVFDQYSKREAIKLLEQQNFIEKKSDSGDAQYVKPIL